MFLRRETCIIQQNVSLKPMSGGFYAFIWGFWVLGAFIEVALANQIFITKSQGLGAFEWRRRY